MPIPLLHLPSIPRLAADPATAGFAGGEMYVRTTDNVLRSWTGAAWVSLSDFRVVKTDANQQNSTVTGVTVTQTAIPVAANELVSFEYYIPYSTAALTTGIGLSVIATGLTATWLQYTTYIQQTVTTFQQQTFNVINGLLLGGAGTSGLSSQLFASIKGILQNGATPGSISLSFRSEVAASIVQVNAGTYGLKTAG